MLGLNFTILCSQLQTVQKTEAGSFPFEETTEAVGVCVCVCVCVSLPRQIQMINLAPSKRHSSCIF